jgi:hypothetical protein
MPNVARRKASQPVLGKLAKVSYVQVLSTRRIVMTCSCLSLQYIRIWCDMDTMDPRLISARRTVVDLGRYFSALGG